MRQEGTTVTKNRDFEEQLRLGSERTTSGIYKKTIGLEFLKRAVGISSGLRKIRNWTLWWGQPTPKRKNLVALIALLAQDEPGSGEHRLIGIALPRRLKKLKRNFG
jgi:hypothetical protein